MWWPVSGHGRQPAHSSCKASAAAHLHSPHFQESGPGACVRLNILRCHTTTRTFTKDTRSEILLAPMRVRPTDNLFIDAVFGEHIIVNLKTIFTSETPELKCLDLGMLGRVRARMQVQVNNSGPSERVSPRRVISDRYCIFRSVVGLLIIARLGNLLFPTPSLDSSQLFFRHSVSSGEIPLSHIQPCLRYLIWWGCWATYQR
jgi:hypothetical protein